MNEHKITQLTTRVAYENKWLRVREDTVRRPDGTQGLYGVVERREFVVLVPWQDGRITMVEQYRYPIRRRLWELPMGTCEPGNTPMVTAATELREETGLVAGSLDFVSTIFQGAGYSDQAGHIFLATDLREGPPAREVSEQGMIHRALTLADVEAMVRDGTLQDAITLATLGILRIRGLL
jgi:8-oxo-dGTP pyrophosphatase MutT (NUDIX family)